MPQTTLPKKKLSLSILFFFVSISLFSQNYILNEDFSSASGTTPPSDWVNKTITGDAEDLWHFDSPGNREVNYPMIGTFAIFDSKYLSGNQTEENIILETPYFDATISAEILCSFDHYFVGGNGATGSIEIYDGNEWQIAKTYTDTTANSEKEILDVSD